jgi:DNA adenine methylase
LNSLGNRIVAEPFAGGAGASLSLLFLEETPEIAINDADSAIYAFWWTLKNRSGPFLKILSSTRATMDERYKQREVNRKASNISKLRRGFAAFFLNRCNHSGIIINGGPIGGINQTGTWKIDARFNTQDLVRRCKKVVEYKDRISVSGEDGIDFIGMFEPQSTFFFVDPPYFEKGPTLYLNRLDFGYHKRLAEKLRSLKDDAWMLTYDDCPEIRRMYNGWASIRPFSLRYVASERKMGNEVLITPKWMHLPRRQESASLGW